MSLQLSIEVHRFKISRSVWHSSKSRKIVAYAEFVHRNKVFRSRESQVYTGSQYNLPWNEAVDKITLHFFYIDALLTVNVGTAVYEIGKDKKFAANGNIVQVVLDINIDGCSERIGRVMCNVAVQGTYDGERNTTKPDARRSRNDDRQFAVSAPDFRFKQLNRPIHWDRIRGVNIDRIVQNNDTRTLLACLDDVVTGDVTQQDVDPKLFKAMQTQQYNAQYLLSCHSLLRKKERSVREAVRVFEDEERLLDLKIAKMRARAKALRRESRDCDRLCSDYSSLLRDLNPRLLEDLYRTYAQRNTRTGGGTRLSADETGVTLHDQPNVVLGLGLRGVRSDACSRETASGGLVCQSEQQSSWRSVNNGSATRGGALVGSHGREPSGGDRSEDEDEHVRTGSTNRVGISGAIAPPPVLVSGDKQQLPSDSDSSNSEEGDCKVNGQSGFKTVGRITALKTSRKAGAVTENNSDGRSPPSSDEPDGHINDRYAFGITANSNLRQSVASTAMSVDSLAPATLLKPAAVVKSAPRVTIVRPRDQNNSSSDSDSDTTIKTAALAALTKAPTDSGSSPGPRDSDEGDTLTATEKQTLAELAALAAETQLDDSTASVSMIDMIAPGRGVRDDKDGLDSDIYVRTASGQQSATGKYDYKMQSPPDSPIAPGSYAKHQPVAESKRDASATSEDSQEDEYDDDPFSPYTGSRGSGRAIARANPFSAHVDTTFNGDESAGAEGGAATVAIEHTYGSDFESDIYTPIASATTGGAERNRSMDRPEEVDTSRSVTIEFAFPSVGNPLGGSGPRDTRWDADISRDSNGPATFGSLQLMRDNSGDNVLLGTAKYSQSRRFAEDTSTPVAQQRLSGTDQFDRDSLAGTDCMEPRGANDISAINPRHSTESPWNEDASVLEDTAQLLRQEPTVDGDVGSAVGARWVAGRAGLEAVELAQALDVLVSAIKIDPAAALAGDQDAAQISISLCFMGVDSAKSRNVTIYSGDSSLQPIGFAAHMAFNDTTAELLSREIADFEDALAFQINVYAGSVGDDDDPVQQFVGQANISLWVMLEDSCNILRQEVDVLTVETALSDDPVVIGTAVVDVRGYRLLKKHQQSSHSGYK